MKDLSWINNPALKNIDSRKLAVLIEIMNEADGKSLEKSLPILVNANNKLKEHNLTFTPEETSVIFEILTLNMSADEKLKIQGLKKLLESKINSRK